VVLAIASAGYASWNPKQGGALEKRASPIARPRASVPRQTSKLLKRSRLRNESASCPVLDSSVAKDYTCTSKDVEFHTTYNLDFHESTHTCAGGTFGTKTTSIKGIETHHDVLTLSCVGIGDGSISCISFAGMGRMSGCTEKCMGHDLNTTKADGACNWHMANSDVNHCIGKSTCRVTLHYKPVCDLHDKYKIIAYCAGRHGLLDWEGTEATPTPTPNSHGSLMETDGTKEDMEEEDEYEDEHEDDMEDENEEDEDQLMDD